jgi:hypothetical protein
MRKIFFYLADKMRPRFFSQTDHAIRANPVEYSLLYLETLSDISSNFYIPLIPKNRSFIRQEKDN